MKKNTISFGPKSIFFAMLVTVILLSIFSVTAPFGVEVYESKIVAVSQVEIVPVQDDKKTAVLHLDIPEPVKALYMTSCVASSRSLRDGLVKFIEETELNSVIIDIKDYTGTVSFTPKNDKLLHAVSTRCPVSDLEEFITHLHQKDIYVIGRLTVFQDPHLAGRRPDLAVLFESSKEVWKDNKGLSFIDVGAKEAWKYNIDIVLESYGIGFDEINFDYIRYPSDGPMKDIYFPHTDGRKKADVLEDFFAYLYEELKDTGIVTSADLFGMTTTVGSDMNIGQVLERALPYFDYISPMVYPSHYPVGFNGWGDPNKYPYEVVNFAMETAVDRVNILKTSTTTPQWIRDKVEIEQLRPWLQDFDYGGVYGVAEVEAQIKAVYDAGLTSWMMWDPANHYTRSAYKKEL